VRRLIDRPGVYAQVRVIDTDKAASSLVLGRINEMVAVARTKYGSDSLFDDLLDEVASLCLQTTAIEVLDGSTAPPDLLKELTRRERQVAALLVAGKSDREIGAILGVASCTARSHSKAILAKLEIHSRHELRYLLRSSPIGGRNAERGG
jgi:DNA-binding NarL/FixJ family response regulator